MIKNVREDKRAYLYVFIVVVVVIVVIVVVDFVNSVNSGLIRQVGPFRPFGQVGLDRFSAKERMWIFRRQAT